MFARLNPDPKIWRRNVLKAKMMFVTGNKKESGWKEKIQMIVCEWPAQQQTDGQTDRRTDGQGEVSTIIFGMLESSGFRKYSTLVAFQLFYRRLCLCLCLCLRLCHCLCLCLCLCISISVWIWIADVMSFRKMYGLRGPWGLHIVNQALRKNIAYWTKRRMERRKKRRRRRKIPGVGRYPTTTKDKRRHS